MRVGSKWSVLAFAVLWFAVLGSAAGAVYCKYRARELFVRLEQLGAARDEYDAEWGRLQLEQAAWSNYSLIENTARVKLQMRTPDAREVEIVGP